MEFQVRYRAPKERGLRELLFALEDAGLSRTELQFFEELLIE